MEIQKMNLKDYCCLNRPRFMIDPQQDAEWYFGNSSVQDSIIERLKTDIDVRGIPKFGFIGRFGSGKTHTLFHLKHLFEKSDPYYRSMSFYLRVAPYSEDDPKTRGWGYIHRKILDSMGESFLRELVKASDNMPGSRERDLIEVIREHFKFGDANLKQSLAYVLSSFFLRDIRDTSEAWGWLRGQVMCQGATKTLDNSSDMVHILLNIGTLARWALQKPIVLLFDEAQALAEVKKASEVQIHDSLLQLAEPDNQDVGFVLATFGTGSDIIPPVIMRPPDIISRLGVTESSLQKAFIDLKDIVRQKSDFLEFAKQVLKNLIDESKAKALIDRCNLASQVSSTELPFTGEALNRIAETVSQQEPNRNPRRIIGILAQLASEAYQKAKTENKYIIADKDFVNARLRDF